MAARYESWNIFSVSFWKKCCRKLTQFEAYGPRNYFFCHLRKLPAWSTFSRTPLSFGSLPTSGSFVPQVSSVAQSCPTLCDCSTPGFLVHHQLLELIQTYVHWVGDAIQPSHPLSSPSLAFSLSQHQGLFQWVSSSHQVAKVLEFQHQSFQWIFRTDLL